MFRPYFLIILLFFQLPCLANDLFLTPFHGKNGATADSWLIIQDARHDISDFSFVINFDPSIIEFEELIKTENIIRDWQIKIEQLPRQERRERLRIYFKTEIKDNSLARKRDYLLCRLRFKVNKDQASFLRLEEPKGDISNWQLAGANFFYTEQDKIYEEESDSNHISCFIKSLTIKF